MSMRIRPLLKRSGGTRLIAFLLPILLLLGLSYASPPLLTRLDLLTYDILSKRLSAPLAATKAVVVGIDETDLSRLGGLPLARTAHADLLARLRKQEAGSISFAILMDKPGLDAEGDQALADQIALADAVVMPVMPAATAGNGMTVLRSLDIFRIAVTEGHVDVEIDPDGVTRRIYLSAGSEGQWWPPLALAALLRQSSWSAILPGGRLAPDSGQALDGRTWQRDRELLLRNDLIGPVDIIPFRKVLNNDLPAGTLRDRAIFIGVTASGANGALALANSDKGVLIPAVEYHARVFEALAHGAVVTPLGPSSTLLLGMAILIAAGIGCCWLPGNRSRLTLLALCFMPAVLAFGLIHLMGLWFAPVSAGLSLTLLVAISFLRQLNRFETDTAVLSEQAKVAMESIADGVIVIDNEGRIEQANGIAARLIGVAVVELCGRNCGEILGGSGPLLQCIAECLANNRPAILGDSITLSGHPPCTVRVSIGPVAMRDGKQRGAVLVLSDVSPLMAAERRLKHQATHDDLTGLPNRTLVQDRLQQQLSGLQRRNARLMVLFLDLDRFKRINDGAGHQTGDEILRAVARRLSSACRAEDTVGRWGGDEFVVLLSGEPVALNGEVVARKLIDQISEPILVDGIHFHVGASIGIAIAPEDSQNPEELIRLADLAMYRAKMGGGNRLAFASADMNRNSAQRLEIEVGLRKALQKQEFEIHYQPQVSMAARHLTGLEALIRWRRPGIGLLQPDQFIPIAEESGLINEIGRWVLNEVGRQLAEWRAAGCAVVPVAVNVSARQCQNVSLADEVRQMLERHGIPADLIEIEITETAAVENLEQVTQLLNELSRLGIRLAMDDFGTGYSSLAHLKALPISILKIDKSFVGGTPGNHEDSSISRATIALAHSLGMTVVAEGVENEQQRAFLDNERCDVAQGFLFDRPIHASKMLLMLRHASFAPTRSLAAT